MAQLTVSINPKILKWARGVAGFEKRDIADEISVSEERYSNWEKDGHNIPFGKLQLIANKYKRQIAFFFLPEVPVRKTPPKDYRNLNPLKSKLSKQVLLALRDAENFQSLSRLIEPPGYWNEKSRWLNEMPEKSISQETFGVVRKLLSITIEEQIEWDSDRIAYKYWRQSFETKLGILVFQFPMPLDEVHGFCISDDFPLVIVTNSNHPYTGRIFTLFHEFAHIISKQSALCLVDEVKKEQDVEWACNSFAGSFLAPSEVLIDTKNLTEISRYASRLKISREAYLRRMWTENLINDSLFYELLEKIKATYKPKTTGGFVPPEKKSIASRGETFFTSVINAAHSNKISYTQASSALNLSVPRIINA